jgi:hypothetical protein
MVLSDEIPALNQQPAGLEESKRRLDWARADVVDFDGQ